MIPLQYRNGNLLEMATAGDFDVIVHGCNCMCVMGAGIAKQIKKDFPEAYLADKATIKGDISKLGTCTYCSINRNGVKFDIVNAYIQHNYGTDKPQISYDALRSCFKHIKQKYSGKRIGMPKIGAGLAGGDWSVIEKIITEELGGESVTVVKLIEG